MEIATELTSNIVNTGFSSDIIVQTLNILNVSSNFIIKILVIYTMYILICILKKYKEK